MRRKGYMQNGRHHERPIEADGQEGKYYGTEPLEVKFGDRVWSGILA